MSVEEQVKDLEAKVAELTQALAAKNESTETKSAAAEAAQQQKEPTQDEIIAKVQAEQKAKAQQKQAVAAQAKAYTYITQELPTLQLAPETQAVIGVYGGDKDDYIAHQEWIMRAYLKNEALARITPEQLEAMPKMYRDAISLAKSSDNFDIPTTYNMVREMEEAAKRAAEAAEKAKSLQVASQISEAELAKLSPQKQAEYHASQAYSQADKKRWENFASQKK